MRTKLEYLAKQTAKEDQCLTVIFMDWWCDQNFKLGETKFTTVETKTNGDVLRTAMELEIPQKRSRIELHKFHTLTAERRRHSSSGKPWK